MSYKKLLMAQFDLHNVLYNNVLAGVTDDESKRVVAENMNTVKWLAGHLLWAQWNLGNIGGVKLFIPWRDHFHSKEGADPDDLNAPKSELPALDGILNKWNEVNPYIRAGLDNLSDEALTAAIIVRHPIYPFDQTLGGLWAFTNHHQAFTIGQIAILRRGLGKPAMSYANIL
jgi:hypothetical protein